MISVVIPMFNAEKSIVRTLDSVKDQTWKGDFEIIIVDDGSTDNSSEIVENYINENQSLNINFLQQENSGVSKARNTALKVAKGDYIAFLDSDDEWLPEKTERQLFYLENTQYDIDFLSCRRNNHVISWPYSVDEDNLAEVTFRKILLRNEVQPSTVIFKHKILEEIGYFDDSQRYSEDINYWLKISKKFKIYILNENLVTLDGGKRTFGVSGLSANLVAMEAGFQKNLREMYVLKYITYPEFLLYKTFYYAKYLFRLLRNRFLKFRKQ